MMERGLKIQQLILIASLMFLLTMKVSAQYSSFKVSPTGDTLNIVDKKGLKQGKWVNTVGEVRGNPGYEEEGVYKDDKKNGPWRKYNETGDLIAVENFRLGGKDGSQEYFNFLGSLERHEEWRGYNPDAPYDTIPVYGSGSNEILSYKVVKAEQYSVPHGDWKYFDQNGHITKLETYDRGRLLNDNVAKTDNIAKADPAKPKEKVKTKEILEYEKKYSKKKRTQMEREGKTSL